MRSFISCGFLLGTFALAFPSLGRGDEEPEATIQILATFDYPLATTQTSPQGINDLGDVSGFYNDATGATVGFIRLGNGRFSPPLIDPDDMGNFTQGRGLNNDRVLCGYYSAPNFSGFHGFFLSDNLYATYDVPGSTSTVITGLNDAGDFVGEYATATQAFVAYSNLSGMVTTITIPNATTSSGFDINNAGEIVGDYVDDAGVTHGFYQDAAGGLIFPIDAPGATATFPFAIDDRGQIVGRFVDNNGAGHGFLLRLPNQFVQYDFPGATFTSLNGLNSRGLCCGRYDDGSGIVHGFIGRVR
jgi:uncharacterized membrane protein